MVKTGVIFAVLLICLSLKTASLNAAEPPLQVVGLFKNAALVKFDGKQKLYRSGQQLSANIKLLEATPRSATFVIDGKTVKLGLQQNSGYSAASQPQTDNTGQTAKQATILRNIQGMYDTPGFINGVAVRFLVDTGASQVAINESIARLAGLQYKLDGRKVGVSTAAGMVPAWMVKLKKVRVGEIEISNIDALVIKGTGPKEALLGMSFLKRVKMEDNGQILKLVKKY